MVSRYCSYHTNKPGSLEANFVLLGISDEIVNFRIFFSVLVCSEKCNIRQMQKKCTYKYVSKPNLSLRGSQKKAETLKDVRQFKCYFGNFAKDISKWANLCVLYCMAESRKQNVV